MAIAELLQALPKDLKDCYKSKTDVKAIFEWAQIFTDKTALIADVTKHWRHELTQRNVFCSHSFIGRVECPPFHALLETVS